MDKSNKYFTTNVRLIKKTILFIFGSNMKYYISRNKMVHSADYWPIMVDNIKHVFRALIVMICSKGKIIHRKFFIYIYFKT